MKISAIFRATSWIGLLGILLPYANLLADGGATNYFYKDQKRVTLTATKDIEVDVTDFVNDSEDLSDVPYETDCYVPEIWEENLESEALKKQVDECNSYLNFDQLGDILVIDRQQGNFKTSDTKFEWSGIDPI